MNPLTGLYPGAMPCAVAAGTSVAQATATGVAPLDLGVGGGVVTRCGVGTAAVGAAGADAARVGAVVTVLPTGLEVQPATARVIPSARAPTTIGRALRIPSLPASAFAR